MRINIDSGEALGKAAIYYHDAKFLQHGMKYTEAERVFKLELTRVKYEEMTILLNLGFLKLCMAPRTTSVMVFLGVNGVSYDKTRFTDDDPPGNILNFVSFYPDEHRLELACDGKTKINLNIKNINGYFEDNQLLGKLHYISFFGAEIERS
ncbi:MAG TPA: DUF2948 family protein [bacterium]